MASNVREVLLDFMRRSGIENGFPFRSTGLNPLLKEKFYGMVNSSDPTVADAHIKKYGTTGMTIAATAYRHTSIDMQAVIAFYTFCVSLMDDDVLSTKIIRQFAPRLFDHKPQPHPLLARFAVHLADMYEHFSPFSATVIGTFTLDFLNGEMLTRDEGGPEGPTSRFADYIRLKTGLGEVFAAFMFPRSMFPDSKTYVQAFP